MAKGGAVVSAAKAKRVRRRRDFDASLPQYLPKACEFSDDPSLTDRSSLLDLIQEHLTGGNDQFGQLWDDIREKTSLQKPGGRPRMSGDWALAAVLYVMSRSSEVYGFWNDKTTEPLWEKMGFKEIPSYQSVWLRFAELEQDECVQAFEDAADALVRHARSKDSRVGRDVKIDGSAFHSPSRLHHDCADKDACKALCKKQGKRMPKTLNVAGEDLVRAARQRDAKLPEDMFEGALHPSALAPAATRKGGSRVT